MDDNSDEDNNIIVPVFGLVNKTIPKTMTSTEGDNWVSSVELCQLDEDPSTR